MPTFYVHIPVTIEEPPIGEDTGVRVAGDLKRLMFRVEATDREEAVRKFHDVLKALVYGTERNRVL